MLSNPAPRSRCQSQSTLATCDSAKHSVCFDSSDPSTPTTITQAARRPAALCRFCSSTARTLAYTTASPCVYSSSRRAKRYQSIQVLRRRSSISSASFLRSSVGYQRRDATGTRGSRRRRARRAERRRFQTVCRPWARCGSSAAPQIEQPAAKAVACEPQFGQIWGFLIPSSQTRRP